MKKIFVVITMMAFIFGAMQLGLAGEKIFKYGTITKIQGDKITFKDDKGQEHVFQGKSKGLKVGDKVRASDGQIESWSWGMTPGKVEAPSKVEPKPLGAK